jgi:hypothetical protein
MGVPRDGVPAEDQAGRRLAAALTGAADDSQWGSAMPDPYGRGWWLTGTRNTGGTGCVADCKTMDTAYVPLNAMTHPSAWHVRLGVLPAGEGYDLGTVVSMSHVSGHGWVAYTKRDDSVGSTALGAAGPLLTTTVTCDSR